VATAGGLRKGDTGGVDSETSVWRFHGEQHLPGEERQQRGETIPRVYGGTMLPPASPREMLQGVRGAARREWRRQVGCIDVVERGRGDVDFETRQITN